MNKPYHECRHSAVIAEQPFPFVVKRSEPIVCWPRVPRHILPQEFSRKQRLCHSATRNRVGEASRISEQHKSRQKSPPGATGDGRNREHSADLLGTVKPLGQMRLRVPPSSTLIIDTSMTCLGTFPS